MLDNFAKILKDFMHADSFHNHRAHNPSKEVNWLKLGQDHRNRAEAALIPLLEEIDVVEFCDCFTQYRVVTDPDTWKRSIVSTRPILSNDLIKMVENRRSPELAAAWAAYAYS